MSSGGNPGRGSRGPRESYDNMRGPRPPRGGGAPWGGRPDMYPPPPSEHRMPPPGSWRGPPDMYPPPPSERRMPPPGAGWRGRPNQYQSQPSEFRAPNPRGDRRNRPEADRYQRPPSGHRGSDASSERAPSERGDGSSFSAAARQKKSHPIGGDIIKGITQLSIQEGVRRPPPRPESTGSTCRTIQLVSNCWDLKFVDKTMLMYALEVDTVYRIDSKENKKIEVKRSPKEKRDYIIRILDSFPKDIVYDGGHIIYSEKPLPGVGPDEVVREVTLEDSSGQETLKYRILEVQKVSTSDVVNYIDNPRATSLDLPQESMRLLNCILRTISKDRFIALGRQALFCEEPLRVVHDKLFSIHKGFITSVRPQWKVRVNVNMICKAFFTAGNMADVLYGKYGDNMTTCGKLMASDCRNIRVETIPFYTNEKGEKYSKKYRVHDLSDKPANKLIIPELNISVCQYFKEHHNIQLQYPDIPCVKVNKTRDVYLPMELLNILPYQPPNAKKSDVASEVIRSAAVKPGQRFAELQQFVENVARTAHPTRKQCGIEINTKSITLTGRLLEQPAASFGRDPIELGRGKWNAMSFYKPAGDRTALNWAIIAVPRCRYARNDMNMLSEEFPKSARSFNLMLGQPQCIEANRSDLPRHFSQLKSAGCRFILLVLYDELDYPTIKRLGDLDLGIPTQCVRSATLKKPRVIPNLLLKLNGKLGGINWMVPDLVSDDLVMVFGADVTHPSPTQTQQVRKSIAAVIGSVTPDLMRYSVVIRQQHTAERNDKTTREIIDNLKLIVLELLKTFLRNTNGKFPTRLIFYRDGVSEGQFENVLVEELGAIQQACSEISPGYEPGVTYIVVQKRHHVRFRSIKDDRNVPPGTVVDSDVTHHREFDFYLCSQEGIQGTSKPAHYHVLYDDNNWDSEALQTFTYHLCHAYMRCPRSVSYPAPTYYAHLAAFRARDWLTGWDEPDKLLDNGQFVIHANQVSAMFYL